MGLRSARVITPVAFVVGVWMIFSAEDYFMQERNAADYATLGEMYRLCRSTLAPFDPSSPEDSLSKQTLDDIALASRSYCSRSRASVADALSVYHLFGGPSRAGVCKVTEATASCLRYLQQRLSGRQQRLPADFESRANDLFKKIKINARSQPIK